MQVNVEMPTDFLSWRYIRSVVYWASGHANNVEILKHITGAAIETPLFQMENILV